MTCPSCGFNTVQCNGHRYLTNNVDIQRYSCKKCGYRFSDPTILNVVSDNSKNSQVCVQKVAKNLTQAAINKIVAGTESQELRGNFALYLQRASQKGYSEITIEKNLESISWLAKNTDLDDSIKVWHKIDNQKQWKYGNKQRYASAYKNYCKILKKPINEDLDFNKWVLLDRLPSYIPTETEIIQLVSGCNKKTSTMIQLLYETGIRSGEAWLLQWENFDLTKRILTLNAESCEKKGVPRQFKISEKLVAMLNLMKIKNKTNSYIWNSGPDSLNNFRSSFHNQRKHLAVKLNNPNLTKITLHKLRHFYATNLYHSTKDILLVKERLGHRNIQNTLVYTRIVEWDQPNKWIVRRPTTTLEEDQLIEAGFEYVRFDDKTQTPIYRKLK